MPNSPYKSSSTKIFINESYIEFFKFTEAFIFKQIGEGKRILDIGCRNGLFTERINKFCKAKEIIAIDIFEEGIKSAQEKGKQENVHYLQENGENLASLRKLGPYDVIHLRNTFHHFKNPHIFLKKAIELLNDNGKIILIDIDYESMFWFLRRFSAGLLITLFSVIQTLGLKKALKAMIGSGYLSKEFGSHHKNDISFQKKIGWFRSFEIFKNFSRIYKKMQYGRLGSICKKGGVYYMLFSKEEKKG